MEREQVANYCEQVIHNFFREEGCETVKFTPSIVAGRRYLCINVGSDEPDWFHVEINVMPEVSNTD